MLVCRLCDTLSVLLTVFLKIRVSWLCINIYSQHDRCLLLFFFLYSNSLTCLAQVLKLLLRNQRAFVFQKHGTTQKPSKPITLDVEDQQKMAKVGLEMKLLTSEVDAEAEKWDEYAENDIVKRAKAIFGHSKTTMLSRRCHQWHTICTFLHEATGP